MLNKSNQNNNTMSRNIRITKTILLACIWISLGFNIEIFGPALEDFKILFNINYENIAIILIMRTTGNIIATFLTGLILDRVLKHSNIVIITAMLIFIMR